MSGKYDKYTEEELTAFAIGELDETRAAEVDQLLAGDPQGRRTVDELRSVAGLLTEQFAAEPVPALTDDQRRAVESAGTRKRSGLRLHVRLRVSLSMAASILVMLGAALLVMKYWPESSDVIVKNSVDPAPKIEKKVPLEIKYPRAGLIKGTPPRIEDPHIAPPSLDPPDPIYVPVGTSNLSRGRAVSSNSNIPVEKLGIITDGDKKGSTGLDIGAGLKWVQIDLGAPAEIYAVAVWHYYDDGEARAYRDVIVQVSDDPNFAKYTTVFSTDHDKSAGMETGPDMGYVESRLGKVVDCKGVVGRYVRLYTRGNTSDDRNHYAEVEIHGVASADKAATSVTPTPTPTASPAKSVKPKPTPRKAKKVPLIIRYPKPVPGSTPKPMKEPNICITSLKRPKAPMMPAGTVNIALGKPVTSNETLPVVGDLEMVTDGDKNGEDGHNVDVGFGRKWVQIDLQSACSVSAIGVWHFHGEARAYRDVVVHISNDPEFIEYETVFNSDHDNSSGLGLGEDMGYVETYHGKFMWCPKLPPVRYVRLYSKGNTSNDQNHYVEVEVYGRPPKGKAPTTRPSKAPTTRPAPTPTLKSSKPAKSKRSTKPKKVPLIIKYPKALFIGTPVPLNEPNISKPSGKPPRPPMMPTGTVNLALGKLVTSNQLNKPLDKITDGDKRGDDGCDVSLGKGLKWVQIDLEAACSVSAIGVWHYHKQARAYRDVVVHISDDPDFIEYKTIFNSDHDNSAGMGIGENMGYVETRHGKLIWCDKPETTRYVRLYSRGNTSGDDNHYIEVEVYGRKPRGKAPPTKPAKAKSPTTRPANSRTKKTPLVIKYPKAKFKGTPMPMPNEPNVPMWRQSRPELLIVPEGTVNLALRKPVTSNEPLPIVGDLDMVTDGDKSCEDGHNVDIGLGLKWVQIDLLAPRDLSAIVIWHYYRNTRAYRDVVVRISSDPDFIKYTTIFNADHDNSSGFGIGADVGYIETIFGKLIDCKGLRGRYVRLYSNGNTSNDQNHYIEVEVYGRKIKAWWRRGLLREDANKAPLKLKYPKRSFCG
ncbi:MAG: discoidin domain-containing protein [Phycisphaerae bacterium]|jgi:hypothetical protein|nr:discoidin domain-containing protein [Phycisphaerae bacterium]